jgi:hypothetical protein
MAQTTEKKHFSFHNIRHKYTFSWNYWEKCHWGKILGGPLYVDCICCNVLVRSQMIKKYGQTAVKNNLEEYVVQLDKDLRRAYRFKTCVLIPNEAKCN